VYLGRNRTPLGNGWALVDLGDFKSLSRAIPSEVGSIPTHSRQHLRGVSARGTRAFSVKVQIASIVAGCLFASMSAAPVARAQLAAPDTTVAPVDTVRIAPPDTLRNITVHDSLGVRGTIKGQTDPAKTKAILQQMGSNEVVGRTQWERRKNPKVAMLCHTLLPGLGQTYNGRRLKVGLMAGFASYYYGTTWLSYKKWKAAEFQREQFDPGSADYVRLNNVADFYKEEARTFLWWSGAVWLIGLVDSWIDAHLYDVRSYTPPSPPDSVTPTSMNERTNYLTLGFTLERSK
jgi:hypothetical protein